MLRVLAGIAVFGLLFNSATECRETGTDFSSVETIEMFEKSREQRLRSGKTINNQIDVVMVELSNSLIQDLNDLWKDRSTDFRFSDTVLATFDSSGLRDKVLYRDSSQFIHAIKNLRTPSDEAEYLPTFHAIYDLTLDDYTDSSVLLVTKAKISDKDFGDVLAESLVEKRNKLSILWSGSQNIYDYGAFLDMARTTGGKFEFLLKEPKKIEKAVDHIEQRIESFQIDVNNTDLFSRIRFPDGPTAGDINSLLSLRAGNDRFAVTFQFPVMVEVASGASLEIRPGVPTQIPFTVKNNLNTGMNVMFGANYKNTPQFIQPDRAHLPPLATLTAVVHLKDNPNRPTLTNSTLTFAVFFGNKVVSRTAIVSLLPLTLYDKTQPQLSYKFGGDCTEYQGPKNCEKGFWGVEITAQDEESGILKIISEPYGLLFQPEFVAGTKAPVTAYYSATCCQPKVDIWAEDLHGNFARKSLDVFNQSLLAGEIAAIVVGVLLLIFIIIAIFVAIALVKRRNRRNLIVARPRADSR